MIQALLAAFLVWAFFRIKEKDVIDGFLALTFILVPAILLLFIGVAVAYFALPPVVYTVSESLYFLVPLLMIKHITDFTWGKVTAYAAVVFLINFITQLGGVILLGMPPSA